MSIGKLPPGFEDMLKFPFVEVLTGRRSRRFFRGAEISEGALAYKSKHEPFPLSELEKLLILSAVAGNTGWHYLAQARGQSMNLETSFLLQGGIAVRSRSGSLQDLAPWVQ